jgi:uncharacterized surface protein with fasciclin (FAS1) repeats
MSTILQIAGADKNLTTLIQGVKAANLEEQLNGFGPFTILAPVNLAFIKLTSPDSFNELVKQSSSNSKLSEILSYHVLIGRKLVKDFRDGQKLPTVNGLEVSVTVINGEVRINGAKILSRDRQGSNGVVHSIDAVNQPAS